MNQKMITISRLVGISSPVSEYLWRQYLVACPGLKVDYLDRNTRDLSITL